MMAWFEPVERQTAFPIRTLLKIQHHIQGVCNVRISTLVWFIADQGDEWRIYAYILDDKRCVCSPARKFMCFCLLNSHSESLTLGMAIALPDKALQLLLIVDYICD